MSNQFINTFFIVLTYLSFDFMLLRKTLRENVSRYEMNDNFSS